MKIATLKDIEKLLIDNPDIKIELTQSQGRFFVVIQMTHNKLTLQHSNDTTLAKAFKKMNKYYIDMSGTSR